MSSQLLWVGFETNFMFISADLYLHECFYEGEYPYVFKYSRHFGYKSIRKITQTTDFFKIWIKFKIPSFIIWIKKNTNMIEWTTDLTDPNFNVAGEIEMLLSAAEYPTLQVRNKNRSWFQGLYRSPKHWTWLCPVSS